MYNKRIIDAFIDFVSHLESRNLSKNYVISSCVKQFNLIKDGSVFSEPKNNFAVRFSFAKSINSFSNTVLALSKLQKYDALPFIVCLVTKNSCKFYLANSTYLAKISHSSQQLRINNIKGSFNGTDILKNIAGISNSPENFELLYNSHTEYAFEENLERLVESTNKISAKKTKFIPNKLQVEKILTAPVRAQEFLDSSYFQDLYQDLLLRTEKVRDAILVAAFIENINIRGRIIESLITENDWTINENHISCLLNGEVPVVKTNNGLGDYVKNYPTFWTETDVKTKVLFLNSNPKGYNIDKYLEFLSKHDTVFMFFLIGIDVNKKLTVRLINSFQSDLIDGTIIQPHWSGRNSRGVAQFNGKILKDIILNDLNKIQVEKAICFLQKIIE